MCVGARGAWKHIELSARGACRTSRGAAEFGEKDILKSVSPCFICVYSTLIQIHHVQFPLLCVCNIRLKTNFMFSICMVFYFNRYPLRLNMMLRTAQLAFVAVLVLLPCFSYAYYGSEDGGCSKSVSNDL